jgi:hypothetical protein
LQSFDIELLSNKFKFAAIMDSPLEQAPDWTGHLQLSPPPPQAPFLHLKGSVRRIGLVSLPPIAFNHAYDWMTQQTVLCIISDMWLSNKPAKPMLDKNSPSTSALVAEILYPYASCFSIQGFTLLSALVIRQ